MVASRKLSKAEIDDIAAYAKRLGMGTAIFPRELYCNVQIEPLFYITAEYVEVGSRAAVGIKMTPINPDVYIDNGTATKMIAGLEKCKKVVSKMMKPSAKRSMSRPRKSSD